MALFGGSRDISLFRHLNRELLNEIIDTRCDIFKQSIFDSKENLYGEALSKVFLPGVRVAGLIEKEPKEYTSEEIGTDYTRQIKYSFLRDDLASLELGSINNTEDPNENAQDSNIFLEIGDVIFWDNVYCEIDTISQGQYLFGKNPDTDSNGGTHGSSWSVVVETHEMRRSRINTLENVRAGYDEYISSNKIDEQRGGLYG
tara:strand:+ start:2064 stop:2666 length:603 start_codon:yes stop_codon:yes gene_type:complete